MLHLTHTAALVFVCVAGAPFSHKTLSAVCAGEQGVRHQLKASASLIKEERLKIWRALSDLFLDTEIDELTFNYIARTISESKLSLSEVEEILWYEVYPVLEGNLRSVAGVWEGWPDDWLAQHLPAPVRPDTIHGEPSIIEEIKRCWQQVAQIYESQNA